MTGTGAAAQTETVLYSFDSPSGYGPLDGLTFDAFWRRPFDSSRHHF